ncbi:MAG: DUF3499 family protein [Actinobacteria bacterium]|nr:DUF3499 domain-containing protein [Actinomycetota bacterium]MSV64143.1 DUF3499 family protein [Actinomycetota bacterium]MSW25976.1 DUF3499 family protein [Actinomycetota bacterium]MSW33889.1 DUF3499 family protein [Actinomycetota bacterium]MSX30874.1 DUF3499 family protein [Actinomycetota bacterium]
MSSTSRLGRVCSRGGCRQKAVMTLTYVYAESVAVVGPLATFAEPHAYDLCSSHGDRLTVPNGWNVIRQEIDEASNGPSDDDLMAIADAVREVANAASGSADGKIQGSQGNDLGRRGHLRAVPS